MSHKDNHDTWQIKVGEVAEVVVVSVVAEIMSQILAAGEMKFAIDAVREGILHENASRKKIPNIFWRKKKRKTLSSQKRQCMACIV